MQRDLPFFVNTIAAGVAKVRQASRDRVAEQRATVARDYAADFAAFVVAHPIVAGLIEDTATFRAVMFGRVSMGKLWEDLRGEAAAMGGELNNNHRAPAARWLLARHPELVSAIKTRSTPGDPTRAR